MVMVFGGYGSRIVGLRDMLISSRRGRGRKCRSQCMNGCHDALVGIDIGRGGVCFVFSSSASFYTRKSASSVNNIDMMQKNTRVM